MAKEIYLFNPENDMALANFTSYYKAPTEIVHMANDLSVLPAWYAPKNSMIKIDSLLRISLLNKQSPAPGLIPKVEWTDSWKNLPYRPWGWNPSLLYTLQASGIASKYLLTDAQMEKLRFLSGRQRCVDILGAFHGINHLCGKTAICNSVSKVKELVSSTGECILKAPWSGSGRGLVHISPEGWTPSVEGWLARILRVQGEIMVEPLYNKEKDFAMEFYAEGGKIHFAGYSLFETDPHGNYKANILLSDENIERELTQYIPSTTLHCVCQLLEQKLSQLFNKDYQGYLGVDMMICRTSNGHALHPCVEINLRMNMGIVSRIIFNRYIHPQAKGKYIIEHYTKDGEAIDMYNQLTASHPVHLQNEKLTKGYFPLTPILQDTRYHIFLLVE
ncbi:hypothetical protein [Phocaeicola sp.]|jgi:hypothetical protein|uniref:hypothetical protein n=1 Tax=Phocaeicola sp. TaxID=2773926 RepID=UPI003AB90A01